ncbi:hypothetical protein [Gottfriedia acidiceleris]
MSGFIGILSSNKKDELKKEQSKILGKVLLIVKAIFLWRNFQL